jgi:stage V sporulation protein SpoVS
MFVRHIAPELKAGSINARRAISELQAWREYHPEAFDDWDQLCWTYIEQPPEWVNWLIQGVKATSDTVTNADELVVAGRAEACAAAALKLEGQFAPEGRPWNESEGNLDNVKVTEQGSPGNSAAYLAARLKKAGRDDLLKQIGPGKQYQSVRSAAIEAGIITPFPSLQLKEPSPTAQKLLSKKGKEWCLELLYELSELVLAPSK